MKIRQLLAVLVLTLSSWCMVTVNDVQGEEIQFTDITNRHMYYMEIMALAELGVINGYPDGTFRNKSVSRAEFSTFIARALELPESDSRFKDVPETAPLYDGVSRAANAGIIKGFTDGTFRPTERIKREDVAVMIDRALQFKGIYTDQAEIVPYIDRKRISSYALESVDRVYHYDVMGPYVIDSFTPEVSVSRGQTAHFLYYMLEAIERETAVK